MRIIQLKAENVKKLSAIDITPNGHTVTIGGKNEAGKSSVLDAIAMALGGAKLAPAQPIRQGEREASIHLDLGDYEVTRKFRRVYKEVPVGPLAPGVTDGVPTNEYTSTLAVSTKAQSDQPAAKFSSPQALLDKIVGTLSFDPLTFATANPTDQAAILRRVVKLDTTRIDQMIKDAEAARVEATREYKQAAARLVARVADAPDQRIEADDLAKELDAAARLDKDAQQWEETVRLAETSWMKLTQAIRIGQMKLSQLECDLADLEEQVRIKKDVIASQRAEIEQDQRNLGDQALNVENAKTLAAQARAKVPETAAIKERILEVSRLNAKFDHNRLVDKLEAEAARTKAEWERVQKQLAELRDDRQTLVENAKFPIEGLAFDGDGVSYKGVPFAQASTAVKLRVSIAVGLALNPTLKVLLIREGAFLDDDNLKLVSQLAEEAGAQVWIERVGTDGVSVVIEDGHVR